jgi:chorismate-pyruvate lyase
LKFRGPRGAIRLSDPALQASPSNSPATTDRSSRKSFMTHRPEEVRPELEALAAIFFPRLELLGEFVGVDAEAMPAPYRTLLAHDEHMTETVEAFHACKVDVRVLARRLDENRYSRKIVLSRPADRRVVMFGIVRIDFSSLDPTVREEIRREDEPLGRILARHNVLRQVQLHELWRVACGDELAGFFQTPTGTISYGRTAMIECNNSPAIELVEIVAPVVE